MLDTFAQVAAECLEKTLALAYLGYLGQARTHRGLGEEARAEDALTVAVPLVEQTRRRLTLDDYRAAAGDGLRADAVASGGPDSTFAGALRGWNLRAFHRP